MCTCTFCVCLLACMSAHLESDSVVMRGDVREEAGTDVLSLWIFSRSDQPPQSHVSPGQLPRPSRTTAQLHVSPRHLFIYLNCSFSVFVKEKSSGGHWSILREWPFQENNIQDSKIATIEKHGTMYKKLLQSKSHGRERELSKHVMWHLISPPSSSKVCLAVS